MSSTKIFASSAVFLAATGLLTASAPYVLTADVMFDRSPVVTMMAHSQLTVGDRLASAGALGPAIEAYGVAAELARAQDKVPVKELRRVANAQFYDGDYRGAAKTLEQLANEAAASGRSPTRPAWRASETPRATLAGTRSGRSGCSIPPASRPSCAGRWRQSLRQPTLRCSPLT